MEERYLKALEQASSVAERDSIRRQIAAEELAALRKSTHFYGQLYPYDIAGSRAHATALAAATASA